VARIAFSDCLTASGIVAAWRARPELLGGTVFPITKSAPHPAILVSMSTQFQPMPLQKRHVQLELSKAVPILVADNY
jgi:hypothetical protein